MLPKDLPGDLPSFLERFGTDAQCRAYLFEARWPAGFRCTACGHDRAWAHQRRLIDECAACGKQHSLLAGTIFEQTKTGLARWFLAIFLVTASKGVCNDNLHDRWTTMRMAGLGRQWRRKM